MVIRSSSNVVVELTDSTVFTGKGRMDVITVVHRGLETGDSVEKAWGWLEAEVMTN